MSRWYLNLNGKSNTRSCMSAQMGKRRGFRNQYGTSRYIPNTAFLRDCSHHKVSISASTHQSMEMFLYDLVNGLLSEVRHPFLLATPRLEWHLTQQRSPKTLLQPSASDHSDCFEPTSYLWVNTVITTCACRIPPLVLVTRLLKLPKRNPFSL